MGVRVSDLQKGTRSIEVEYMGETFGIVYRPGAATAETAIAMQEQMDGEEGSVPVALVDSIVRMVVSWELEDDEDNQIGVTEDVTKRLPLALLNAILTAIADDQNPTPRRKSRR